MKKFKRNIFWSNPKIILGIALCLMIAGLLLLRLYHFGQLPNILNRDEAALAYNAYLLKEVGLDEWARPWSVTLASFGDYKLIGYPTILVGLFQIAGEYDWVVRLPSFLAGIALAWAILKFGQWLRLSKLAQLFSLFIFASTPIFFFYARMAWEAHLALAYFVGGCYLLFTELENKQVINPRLIFGFLLLLAACLTYNTPLLFLPALIPVMLVPSRQTKGKIWVIALGIGLIFSLVLLWLWPVLSQKSGITIFTDLTVWSNWITWRESLPEIFRSSLGHKWLFWLALMVKNFLASFTPGFLVTGGGAHPWHSLPSWGHLTWLAYFLGWIGLGSIVKNLRPKNIKNLSSTQRKRLAFVALMMISLAPSVVTVDAPHTTRSLFFIFAWVLCAGLGLNAVLQKIAAYTKNNILVLSIILLVFLQVGNFTWYVNQYFTHYPADQPRIFQSGFDSVIKKVSTYEAQQPVAIVDPSGYQYILLAWYLKIDPELYLKTNIRQQPDTIGMRYGQQVGRYHFIASSHDRSESEKILVWWDEANLNWQITYF